MATGCSKELESDTTECVQAQTFAVETEAKTQAAASEAKEAYSSDFDYDEEDGKIVLTSYKGTATDIIILTDRWKRCYSEAAKKQRAL